ncbi:MAG TPA: nucleotidyl transferase AbiEii/AbiGii toxin family protein [Polyangiaceae bacterium]|nr:nucleotidyl transferase AbiEii/AbiGii toxin family protein [Polyangiaceae bacterium]
MDVNEDFVDIAATFVENDVEFVVVGAYALAAHGFPRATGDIDLFVNPTPENAARVLRALADFGAPIAAHGVKERDFEVEGQVYQLGLPPRRIDILTSLSGITFDEAAAEAIEGSLGPVKVRFIGKRAMARNKLASGRPKDLADAQLLEDDE